MKAIIGFVCGIVSVILAIVTFCGGFVCGYFFHKSEGGKYTAYATRKTPSYADFMKQNSDKYRKDDEK